VIHIPNAFFSKIVSTTASFYQTGAAPFIRSLTSCAKLIVSSACVSLRLRYAEASCCSCQQESRHTTVPLPAQLPVTAQQSAARTATTHVCVRVCVCAPTLTTACMHASSSVALHLPLPWAASFCHALRFLDAAPQLRFLSVTRSKESPTYTYVRVASIDADTDAAAPRTRQGTQPSCFTTRSCCAQEPSPCSLGLSATRQQYFSLRTNSPTTSNQPAVLFFQNKPAPAISHQSTEQAVPSFTALPARVAIAHRFLPIYLCLCIYTRLALYFQPP
jgi:hypothetical protein